MIRIALGIVATVLLFTLTARAQAPAPTPATNAAPAPAATPDAAAKAAADAAVKATMAADGCTVEKFIVHSPAMDRDIKALVILPPGYKENPDKKYPILYALHGAMASEETYSKMPTLRAALKEKPMIVACFDGDTSSMYVDAPLPKRWSRDPKDLSLKKSMFTTFFFNEFVPYVDKTYRVNPKQRMLTGFSMGGYGAFLFMVTKPDMFVSVSSMSGGFHDMAPPDDKALQWFATYMGPYAQNEALYQSVDIKTHLKADLAKGEKMPPIYMTCGTEDHLLIQNQKMRDFLKEQGVACEYVEGPGAHDWTFWKNSATAVMDFHWKSLQGK
jgi:S-formylglutathione hydrolase FrmB